MARPRAEDYADKQQAILHGAAAVFASQGMEKASMAEIARTCGISKPLLYHYYASKQALVFEIIMAHLTELDAVTEAADTPKEPTARLEALIIATLESYRDKDDFHQVQLTSTGMLEEAQKEAIRRVERRIVARFTTVLTTINPALADTPHLRMPITMSLFGMLNWVYTWFREDGALDRKEYAQLATRLFVGGLANLR
ncbi:MAG: TetR/AcrR family transcriptional regulator [Pseudomonadota bacterium]